MLPTRLELRNFLAYRAPEPIVFGGIALACLTGDNGVGKSSILDAITWALWGKARARRDDELIHLGQNDMQAQLDFEQEGRRYRVLRRRSRGRRAGRGSLDLFAIDADDFPRLINEAGARRTQEKINAILRLDYETFVHTAYLQQGKADAFTLKTAAERKRVLAEILSLDQWAVYEASTKDRLANLASRIDIIKHDIRRIDAEIADEPRLQSDLEEARTSLAEAQESLRAAEEKYSRVANAAADLRRERVYLREQEGRIDAQRENMAAAQAELRRGDEKIAQYQETIRQSESIEAGFSQLQAARHSQSAIAEQLSRSAELDREAHRIEAALAAQRARLESEAQVLRERVRGLESRLSAGAGDEIQALRAQLATLQALDSQRDHAAKDVQRMNERRSALLLRQESLTAEGRSLNDRLERLDQADGADCPLCGQALTAEHRAQMMTRLTAERNDKRDQYRQCKSEIADILAASAVKNDEIDGWARQLKDLPAMRQRLGALEEGARQAEEAEEALDQERHLLRRLGERLEGGDYGAELRRQLANVERQRERVGYDPDSHADIKTQLKAFAEYERRNTLLEFARISLPEARRRQAETAARLEDMRGAMKQEEAKRERALGEIAALEEAVAQEREERAQVDAMRARTQALNERKTIIEQLLNAIAAGRESKRRLSKRLEGAQRERGLYNELRAAFGKNGLPALIIETAIPELETEANDLLARMTDGRMSLRLRTQREKADGDLAETLSISIADELGARGYELYSGGEAFRINFALRIGLSKLLARRAGARLRALFIDEGFGSQDEDGRDRLVDAISAIQSDFDLILVITHIDELRDAFPAQILVEKTAAGSRVTMR